MHAHVQRRPFLLCVVAALTFAPVADRSPLAQEARAIKQQWSHDRARTLALGAAKVADGDPARFAAAFIEAAIREGFPLPFHNKFTFDREGIVVEVRGPAHLYLEAATNAYDRKEPLEKVNLIQIVRLEVSQTDPSAPRLQNVSLQVQGAPLGFSRMKVEVVRGSNAAGQSVDIAHAYAPFLPSPKPRTATLVVSRDSVPDLALPLTAAQVDLIQ
jgi:hypothetical protein